MLKITTRDENGQTETFDLATQFHAMMQKTAERNRRVSPYGWRVDQMLDEKSEVHLHADSDAGKGLLRLLQRRDCLYDVSVVDEGVSSIPEELRGDIERNLVYERYSSIDELFKDIKDQTKALASHKLSFYCPLTAYINDSDGEYCDADNHVLVSNQELIAEAIADEQACELHMAEYVGDHAALSEKLIFVEWDVEELQGVLYGRIDCYLSEELTAEETTRLRDAIEGQNSDGLGEGFEQREIYIDEGDLYVSYWESGKDYFLKTDEEMDEYLSQSSGMSMGG